MADIRIDGLKELEQALLQLPKALHGKVLGAAVREGAKEIQAEAKLKAPVGSAGHQVGIRQIPRLRGCPETCLS